MAEVVAAAFAGSGGVDEREDRPSWWIPVYANGSQACLEGWLGSALFSNEADDLAIDACIHNNRVIYYSQHRLNLIDFNFAYYHNISRVPFIRHDRRSSFSRVFSIASRRRKSDTIHQPPVQKTIGHNKIRMSILLFFIRRSSLNYHLYTPRGSMVSNKTTNMFFERRHFFLWAISSRFGYSLYLYYSRGQHYAYGSTMVPYLLRSEKNIFLHTTYYT